MAMGHRGAAGEAPENTIPSFERAIAAGAAILESDLHVTADGAIVLLHDDRVDRTTDGTGRALERTLAELRDLDAGFRYSPDGGRSFPYRATGVRIPTLEEAFASLPGARFNLEIKEIDRDAIERIAACVAEAGRAATTLLTAATDSTMAALRAHLQKTGVEVALGASTGDVLGFVRGALEGGEPPSDSMALQIPEPMAPARSLRSNGFVSTRAPWSPPIALRFSAISILPPTSPPFAKPTADIR